MDRYGEIVNVTITVSALLLLLFIGNYNNNSTTLLNATNNITNNISNDDSNNNINNTNTVIPLNSNNDNANSFLLNDNNTSENNNTNSSNNNDSNNNNNDSNKVNDIQVNGNAWLFTYPSIKYVALPVECIALTDIDKVAYVECAIIPPHDSNAYASITITNAHTPTYSPLPSDCNNCKEFNAWLNDSNAPDRSGEWKARALFYSSSNELLAERETTFLVYNAGGGDSERFMVVPESMLGVLSIGIASLASFVVYSLIRVRNREINNCNWI